jgi:NAD(P)-dependent dehydrogenase (short-subunit alcohol dehydrogenase family)
MTTDTPRRWLITGVSSGLGRAIAEYALERGDIVVGTLRQPAQMAAFAALAPGRAFPLQLDVTDDAAVGPAVAEAIAMAGGLDVLVNNAGYALVGAAEDMALAEARRQMETNFIAVLKTCQAVLPHFRAQGHGRILNIASVAAVMSFPLYTLYAASKHAVAGFTEGFAREVKRFGVRVSSVEPGGFRTNFGGSSMVVTENVSEPYAANIEATRARMAGFGGQAANDPLRGAAVIAALVELDEPPVHVALGADGYSMITGALQSRLEEYAAFREMASDTAALD